MDKENWLAQDEVEKAKLGFWRRQYHGFPTASQVRFDGLVGVVLPLICFLADPGVFRGPGQFLPAPPYDLRVYTGFAYVEAAIGIVALIASLKGRPRSALLAGVLFAGCVSALMFGFLLFPASLLGLLFFFVGLLGFAPFLAAFVFARNAFRVFPPVSERFSARVLAQFLVALVLVLGIPAVGQMAANHAIASGIAQIVSGTADEARAAGRRLSLLRFAGDIDPLILKYEFLHDEERKALVEEVYRDMTGESIHERIRDLD